MVEQSSRLFHIESIGAGFLAVMAQPGHAQDAPITFEQIAQQGVHQVVSLLQAAESRALGLDAEAQQVAAAGMSFVSLPIADMGLPASADEFARLASRLYRQVHEGSSTVIHCRAGIGRSGLLAAAVLLQEGRELQQVLMQVSRARGRRVPETEAQRNWLQDNLAIFTALQGRAS